LGLVHNGNGNAGPTPAVQGPNSFVHSSVMKWRLRSAVAGCTQDAVLRALSYLLAFPKKEDMQRFVDEQVATMTASIDSREKA